MSIKIGKIKEFRHIPERGMILVITEHLQLYFKIGDLATFHDGRCLRSCRDLYPTAARSILPRLELAAQLVSLSLNFKSLYAAGRYSDARAREAERDEIVGQLADRGLCDLVDSLTEHYDNLAREVA